MGKAASYPPRLDLNNMITPLVAAGMPMAGRPGLPSLFIYLFLWYILRFFFLQTILFPFTFFRTKDLAPHGLPPPCLRRLWLPPPARLD